jgi:hypothetical protein
MAKFNPKLLFLLGSAFCLADWGYPEVKEVVILERHSHDQFVRDFEVKVVQYSSSMCGHCKQFDHAYSRTALFFKDYHHRVPFASVDCSTNQEFCSDHLVPVYPFVKVYVRNHAITYFGPRTERALKKFVKHILGRNLKIVENTDMVSQARKSNIEGKLRPAILYFGTKTEKQFHMAELLCKVNNKLVCLYTPDTTLASQFGLNSHSKLVMLKTTGKNVIFKAQKFNFDMLEGFVFDNMHRRVHEIGNRFRKSVVNGGRDSLILFVQNILDPISKKFEKAVKAFRKDLPCFIASSDSGDQELVRKLVKALNIDTLPTILLAKHVHGMTFQRYTYKYSLESKHLRNFLENVWNKRLLPDLKSEPAPESNAGPIRVSIYNLPRSWWARSSTSWSRRAGRPR